MRATRKAHQGTALALSGFICEAKVDIEIPAMSANEEASTAKLECYLRRLDRLQTRVDLLSAIEAANEVPLRRVQSSVTWRESRASKRLYRYCKPFGH